MNGMPNRIEENIANNLCAEFISVFSAVNGKALLNALQIVLKRFAAENIKSV
jgi:vacuolar-type H+-ATPase subunit C/Vma6